MKILMICNTDGALYLFRKPIIKQLIASGHELVSISSSSRYIQLLNTLGVKTLILDFARHSVSPLKNLVLMLDLWRMVNNEKPEIVHNFTHKPAIYGSIAARLCGVKKIVVTITGLGTLFINEDLKSRILRKLLVMQYRVALSLVDTVFFQNPDDMDYFVAHKIIRKERAVLTHGSGIDLDEFPQPSNADVSNAKQILAEELGIDLQGKMVVLFPARGVPEKGFFEFYDAAKIISERLPGQYVFVHLGLVDQASLQHLSLDGIEKYAQDCGVRYLGFKDNIGDYMLAADIVSLPSYREGVPRSLIEALALGKVIVTTDAPGCRETVVDGWNGYLCEPRSVESLVGKNLLVDDDLCQLAVERSRQYCEQKFDSKWLVELTISHYQL